MLTLYGRPNSGSAAVEALLAVSGIDHTIVDVPRNADKSAPDWYLVLNPRSEVPTLRLSDGSVMTESAAMMIYLADLVPEAVMAPLPSAPERARYLRWMVYFAVAPYTSDLRMFYSERFSTDVGHAPAIKAKAVIDLARDFAIFDAQMGEGPFILGARMSAADIYAAMILGWSDDVPGLFAKHPKLKRLYDGVAAHPAIRKVWDRNEML